MPEPFKLAVIGDGTSAINALHALFLFSESVPFDRLVTTIYGKNGEREAGRGFAYGARGSIIGSMTESPRDGNADYHARAHGQFTNYAAIHTNQTPDSIHTATRRLVGEFHTHRYDQLKYAAAEAESAINYRTAEVTDIVKDRNGLRIYAGSHEIGRADAVIVAVGDVLSSRFDRAAAKHPGKVFATPYDAVETILENNDPSKIILAFGTRSSFVDLNNGLFGKGFQGKIIGASRSGQTSWQAREGRNLYPLQFLNGPANKPGQFATVREILGALEQELIAAKQGGVYVPDTLIEDVSNKKSSESSSRISWDFDFNAEAAHADQPTYHEVSMAVNWESIYRGLRDEQERAKFENVLGDFALYNRVNRIVPQDYKAFAGHLISGRAKVSKASFSAEDITPTPDNRLAVKLDDGSTVTADYVVNSAIGPVSSLEQIAKVELLANLTARGALKRRNGTGFDVTPLGQDLYLVGGQSRPYSFSSIGLQSNGTRIFDTVELLAEKIRNTVQFRSPATLEHAYG